MPRLDHDKLKYKRMKENKNILGVLFQISFVHCFVILVLEVSRAEVDTFYPIK